MKFTNSRDGRKRVTVRVEYRLEPELVRNYLCAEALVYLTPEEFEALGRAKTEELLRKSIEGHDSDSVWFWQDRAMGEDEAAEVKRIATEKIRKYWPEVAGELED